MMHSTSAASTAMRAPPRSVSGAAGRWTSRRVVTGMPSARALRSTPANTHRGEPAPQRAERVSSRVLTESNGPEHRRHAAVSDRVPPPRRSTRSSRRGVAFPSSCRTVSLCCSRDAPLPPLIARQRGVGPRGASPVEREPLDARRPDDELTRLPTRTDHFDHRPRSIPVQQVPHLLDVLLARVDQHEATTRTTRQEQIHHARTVVIAGQAPS
jgi:hypothetical protein